MKRAALSGIPGVEKLVQAIGKTDLPHVTVVSVIRRELSAVRSMNEVPEVSILISRIRSSLDAFRLQRIQPVINGTGVVVHTNLGRSPLGVCAAENARTIATSYSNLEFDLASGERGRRGSYLEHNLALLCEAEAATVVNNCAAALVLIVRHFTFKKREVIISRGELVQIGGGFRIPEILEASGAKLCEIGTTNKTSLDDYAQAIGNETAMILKVHRSNFFMGGFVDSPKAQDIGELARKKRIPFIEDIGSGAIFRTERVAGLEHEPTPSEVLRHGVDIVCFSGDKLFGGPQAGIIAGKTRFVSALKRNPLFRALRCDKLILSALQSTVDLYLEASTGSQKKLVCEIPTVGLLNSSIHELRSRGNKIIEALQNLPSKVSINAAQSQVGGGTLPHSVIDSVTIDLVPEKMTLQELVSRLRRGEIPIVGRIANGRIKLDLRTIFPSQDEELIRCIRAAFPSSESQV